MPHAIRLHIRDHVETRSLVIEPNHPTQRHPTPLPKWPSASAEELVFANGRGRPIKPDNLRNRVLKPAAERAGLEGIGLHTLRHTCASLLIAEGASMLRWATTPLLTPSKPTDTSLTENSVTHSSSTTSGSRLGVCSKA